jgi:hypothetical protein
MLHSKKKRKIASFIDCVADTNQRKACLLILPEIILINEFAAQINFKGSRGEKSGFKHYSNVIFLDVMSHLSQGACAKIEPAFPSCHTHFHSKFREKIYFRRVFKFP